MCVPPRIDATSKRILYVINLFGMPISKLVLHKILYELKKRGVRLNLKFVDEFKYSIDLEKKLERLIKGGYILRIITTSGSYTELYDITYKLTPKGIEVIKSLDIDKRDIDRINHFFDEMKNDEMRNL